MMKFPRFTVVTVFSLFAGLIQNTWACGPELYEIPSPSYLRFGADLTNENRTEDNIRLWQNQTYEKICENDIREVIYGKVEPDACLYQNDGTLSWLLFYDPEPTQNSFLKYIYNTDDTEALNFIMLAKHVAALREDRNSPWYYPASKNDLSSGFDPAIKTILEYKGTRFYNRYSLQLIRALFAAGRYDESIEAFRERFKGVADNDLMKSMAKGYVAGAALRTDDEDSAIEYFASIGDVYSLSRFCMPEDRAFALCAEKCPLSPGLLKFTENKLNNSDSTFVFNSIAPLARSLASSENIDNRRVWAYVAAMCEGEFLKNTVQASRYIRKAETLRNGSPTDDFVRAYRIKIDARLGNLNNLLKDLRWLEEKISDVSSCEHRYWTAVMQNIVFGCLVPRSADAGDIVTALQLANYGDNMPLKYINSPLRYSCHYGFWTLDFNKESRTDSTYRNTHDFSNWFFRLMNMQQPKIIERYIASLESTDPLARYLNSCGYTNKDYLYEVAGTLYLRYRDYNNAIRVLAKVSSTYQSLLNVDRDGYLKWDPFSYADRARDDISQNKKLYFARKMVQYERDMIYSKDPDIRGKARLEYAIGLQNSFDRCWALTSYQRGFLEVAEDIDCTHSGLDYEAQYEQVCSDAQKMISFALSEMKDRELIAITHHRLSNYVTIAKQYSDTYIGKIMSSTCDAWSDWIDRN